MKNFNKVTKYKILYNFKLFKYKINQIWLAITKNKSNFLVNKKIFYNFPSIIIKINKR